MPSLSLSLAARLNAIVDPLERILAAHEAYAEHRAAADAAASVRALALLAYAEAHPGLSERDLAARLSAVGMPVRQVTVHKLLWRARLLRRESSMS